MMVELAAFLIVVWLGIPLALVTLGAVALVVVGVLYALAAVICSPVWVLCLAAERWWPRARLRAC